MQIYVNCNAKRFGDGSREHPYRKIQDAASAAMPGDEVIVAPGIYREYVDPIRAGREDARIVYRSEQPLGAVITGGEVPDCWEKYQGDVWSLRIPNRVFGSYNPYTTRVFGDWLAAECTAHTGEVFIGGKSLYEVDSLEGVLHPVIYQKSWDYHFSTHTWYTCQDAARDETLIYANFQGKDPNAEHAEISVRRNCFYPSKEGVGYITLSGFQVRIAATQWAPPTAYQEGMVGPHWSRGWIIEDCDISLSKCCGISLGKYLQPENDNKWTIKKFKNGTQTERENICQAQIEGWTKERIGSHIIRRCDIHDCGQTGIVGHLGGVFSLIEDNHIHHINNKRNLAGAEIGGIKMHAAIDVVIRGNHFHHCTRGLWLDWQAQGTRVTGNLFHDNTVPDPACLSDEVPEDNIDVGEDIFVEISHGPTLIDNNILLSDFALKLPTQGVAMVHNLIAGSITAVGRGVDNGSVELPSPRYTPYHVPHRTEIAGFMTVLHGDVRFYNNIFVQKEIRPAMQRFHEAKKDDEWTDANLICGTVPYENYQTPEEYAAMFDRYCGMGAPVRDQYYLPLPVKAAGNVYFNGAKPMSKETDAWQDTEHPITLALKENEVGIYLDTNLGQYLPAAGVVQVSTKVLGMAFEPEQYFENPDGSEILFETDCRGTARGFAFPAGPFASPRDVRAYL